ncbi:MutS domain V domain-containing protein [Besnoitia besnoiti]|uniref:MutS domain V domain-containing protein n=1 Tax=Besnoitia besnoiti TaxID=94643 RepID=A0A2A9MCG0_BESBE|nr:MutS domain V domain-containing protein [Besnoitia besnoiti]PFH33297.1 MutS domain V domain-containing protein [Besnoitia besnoiti]
MFAAFAGDRGSPAGSESLADGSPSFGREEEMEGDEVLCAVEFSKGAGGGAKGAGAGVNVIGVCLFDRRAFKIQFCEIATSNDLAILEAFLLQVRPSCVISTEAGGANAAGEGWQKKLEDLVASCDSEFIRVKKSAADTSSLHQDLATLLTPDDSIKNHISRELQLKTASAACAALLSHARLLSDDIYNNQCTLETYPLDLYLRIDAAAAAALYLFPTSQAQQQVLLPAAAKGGSGAARASSLAAAVSAGGGVSSIFALISRWCTTQLGARRLFTCMAQPLVDKAQIEQRYDIVEIFQRDEAFRRQVFCSHFKHVTDLDRLAGRFHRLASATKDLEDETATFASGKRSIFSRVKLTLEDLVKLYDCAVECTSLESSLRGYEGAHRASLEKMFAAPLSEIVKSFGSFINLIEFTIDMEEAKRGYFVISRRFEPQLAELLDKKDDMRRRMNRERQKAEDEIPFTCRKRDAEIVKLVEDNTMGFVLRVTKKDQPAVQGYRGRYHQVRLNKSEFIFTTSELKALCREYQDVCEAYEEMQKSLVEKALLVAASYWPLVEKLAELLGMLDVLGAFAAAANSAPIPYVRPNIVEGEGAGLALKGSRHPLLEIQPGSSSFISNDVQLDRNRRLIIITGPNMGGKSTYIRQVALTVIMAQMGCFVPCESCTLPIFKQVICRVGASDIQLRGVSTFLAEMAEAAAILRNADEQSLVVIDELGRGTSTYEGFGLAWAIAKHLAAEVKCLCLFATHFHEMGHLAAEVATVVNVHVSAAVDEKSRKLAFLYRLVPGCVDQSYGVHAAEFAGLPESVVARARLKSAELEAVERAEKARSLLQTQPEGEAEAPAAAEERAARKRRCKAREAAFGELANTLKRLCEAPDAQSFVSAAEKEKEHIKQCTDSAAPDTWKEQEAATRAAAAQGVAA